MSLVCRFSFAIVAAVTLAVAGCNGYASTLSYQ